MINLLVDVSIGIGSKTLRPSISIPVTLFISSSRLQNGCRHHHTTSKDGKQHSHAEHFSSVSVAYNKKQNPL